MRIALFGGSFDPVHSEHVRLVCAAKESLALDEVIVIPSFCAPHKAWGAHAAGDDRLEMCKIAFRGLPFVRVSDFELRTGGTSYTYLTCRHFAQEYPEAELYFLLGADMLENFFSWKNPQDIVKNVRIAACGRGEDGVEGYAERFRSEFGCDFIKIPYSGAKISSTRLRTELAFGKTPDGLDSSVLGYIRERGLYEYPAILPALALEKEGRQAHSLGVAILATARARSVGVTEEKALLASALHDCGKSVSLTSPLLEGFTLPEGVPAPVVHQYTGAYLAEHEFGIADDDILNAIRYHTSGREGMTTLEKLVYLSDLLEEGRDYQGVDALRELFWKDLDECLLRSLEEQIAHLERSGKEIYSLTRKAYEWAKKVVKQ